MANYSFNYAFNVSGNCNAVVQEISDNVRRMLAPFLEMVEKLKGLCNLLNFDFETIEPILFSTNKNRENTFCFGENASSSMLYTDERNRGLINSLAINSNFFETSKANNQYASDIRELIYIIDSAKSKACKEECYFKYPEILVGISESENGRWETNISDNHFSIVKTKEVFVLPVAQRRAI